MTVRTGKDAIPGVVLAAGASRRMGQPKCALRIGDRTFASHLAGMLRSAGIAPIVVVASGEVEPIARRALGRENRFVTLAINEAAERGQLSSLQCGLSRVANAPAVVVGLIDVPWITAPIVRSLVDAWVTTGAPLVRPVRMGRHGHPFVIGRAALDALLSASSSDSARDVLIRFRDAAIDVDVADEGPFLDVDTPEDYERLIARLNPAG